MITATCAASSLSTPIAPLGTIYPTVIVNGWTYRVDRFGLIVGNREPAHPPSLRQVAAATRWLARCRMVIRPTVSSYAAKHWAERWAGSYVSNGALLVAAHHCGVPMRESRGVIGPALNCQLGLSLVSLRRLREVKAGEL